MSTTTQAGAGPVSDKTVAPDPARLLKEALFACLKEGFAGRSYGGVLVAPGKYAWVRYTVETAALAPSAVVPEEVRRLSEAATLGPFSVSGVRRRYNEASCVIVDAPACPAILALATADGGLALQSLADAKFFVAAANHVRTVASASFSGQPAPVVPEEVRRVMQNAVAQARGALHLDAMVDDAGKPYGTTVVAMEALAEAEALLSTPSRRTAPISVTHEIDDITRKRFDRMSEAWNAGGKLDEGDLSFLFRMAGLYLHPSSRRTDTPPAARTAGQKIIDGLNDAIAFTKGDTSRARLLRVEDGKVVDVTPPAGGGAVDGQTRPPNRPGSDKPCFFVGSTGYDAECRTCGRYTPDYERQDFECPWKGIAAAPEPAATDQALRDLARKIGEAADDPFADWQVDRVVPVLRAAFVSAPEPAAGGGRETPSNGTAAHHAHSLEIAAKVLRGLAKLASADSCDKAAAFLRSLLSTPSEAQDAGEEPPKIGTPVQAIEFALKIDDHYDMREFLSSWIEGDIGEWPEFAAAIAPPPTNRADTGAEGGQ